MLRNWELAIKNCVQGLSLDNKCKKKPLALIEFNKRTVASFIICISYETGANFCTFTRSTFLNCPSRRVTFCNSLIQTNVSFMLYVPLYYTHILISPTQTKPFVACCNRVKLCINVDERIYICAYT